MSTQRAKLVHHAPLKEDEVLTGGVALPLMIEPSRHSNTSTFIVSPFTAASLKITPL